MPDVYHQSRIAPPVLSQGLANPTGALDMKQLHLHMPASIDTRSLSSRLATRHTTSTSTANMDSGSGAQRAPMTKVQDIIHTFRPSKQFKSPASYTSVDFDDTGEFALLARTDDTIQLFNTKAGAHAKELKSQKYGNALARFTHNSSNIIYASTKVDDGIRYLCMHDNSFIRYFKGHEDRVTSLSLSPGSDHFLSASLDNTVRLWDCRSPNPQGQLNFTSAYLTAYDPSATVIAIASPPAQTVFLYDLKNFDKAPFASFDLLDTEQRFSNSHGMKVAEGWSGLEFSNNGKYLLIATSGAGHYVLDASTLR